MSTGYGSQMPTEAVTSCEPSDVMDRLEVQANHLKDRLEKLRQLEELLADHPEIKLALNLTRELGI